MRRSEDFARTIRSGARGSGRKVVVHLLAPARSAVDHTPGAPPLVGFVVSRAVGPAVVRTRVKRRLRHQVAGRLPGLPAGTQLVVRALPATADAGSAQLGEDLDHALSVAVRRSAGTTR
jgi:ribonuclease P protein component